VPGFDYYAEKKFVKKQIFIRSLVHYKIILEKHNKILRKTHLLLYRLNFFDSDGRKEYRPTVNGKEKSGSSLPQIVH